MLGCGSPDGSKLTFSLNPQADTSDGLYVFDTNTHQAQKIPGSEGYWKSRWSPDGKYLVSVTSNNKTIGVFEWSSQKWTVIVHGNVLSPVAWSNDSRFVFYQDILEKDEPARRFNITTGSSERIVDCRSLLEGGVQRCGFEAVMPDASVVLRLTRGDHDVFSLELDVR
jgi:Tol biopolymer transport system component